MLAPRLNEGCPLARATLRADTSRGSRNGDVVHSAGPALWGLTNQQVSSATVRLREPRLSWVRRLLSLAPSLFELTSAVAIVRNKRRVSEWMAGAELCAGRALRTGSLRSL